MGVNGREEEECLFWSKSWRLKLKATDQSGQA